MYQLYVAWQHTADELYRAYRMEDDRALRTRLHALWLLREGGRSRKEIAAVLGVHVSTIQVWLDWYRVGGLEEVTRHQQGAGGGRTARLSADQELRLWALACTGRFRCIEDARQWVEDTYGIVYTYDGMRSLLDRLEIVSKVPRPCADNADFAAQEAWKKGA